MKILKLLFFLIPASLLGADAANDLIVTQRKSDNSGNIQRNVAAAANTLVGFNNSIIPADVTIGSLLSLSSGVLNGSGTMPITDDTTTNATVYPTWVTANTGNLPVKVSSTKLSFNPSTGATAIAGPLTLSSTALNTLEINKNAAAIGSLPSGGGDEALRIDGANDAAARVMLNTYGNANPNLDLRHAQGTGAAPTATQSGDLLGGFTYAGYGASSYVAGGGINVFAAQNFTNTVAGSYMQFKTSRTGTTTAEAMRISAAQNLLIGTTTDPSGNGGLSVAGTATIGSLTTGRVPFASTGGLLADAASLTFNSGTGALSATSFAGSGASLTTLTAANISTGALANGMTATTQSAGSADDKIATDNYVKTAVATSTGLVEKLAVFTVDGAGSAITTTTVPGTATVPFAATITGWTISATAATGTNTVKFWKVATGTAIPTISNVINTSGVSLTTGTSVKSTTTSDFTTTAVAAFDLIRCSVTAVDGAATDLTVTLWGTR